MNSASNPPNQPNPSRWFWALVAAQGVLWIVAPLVSLANAPLDNVEMLYWGQQWQWGYYKHPPLPAWMAEAAARCLGGPVWPTYLLAQLCLVGCFWSVWKVAREMLEPWAALAASMLLLAGFNYNWNTPGFNNNSPSKACWALAVWAIYWGMKRRSVTYWAAGGAFLGLAFLSKYDVVLLAAALVTFSLLNRRARASWSTPGPYVLAIVGLLIVSPHLWWLVANDFPTLEYVRSRSEGKATWARYLIGPFNFVGAQLAAFALTFLMATTVLGWRWKWKALDDERQFDRQFLLWVVLGPLGFALLASLATGANLRTAWGVSMFSYVGLLLLLCFEFKPDAVRLRRMIYGCAAVSLCMAIAFCLRNLYGGQWLNYPLRTDFPGQQLTQMVETFWGTRENQPLRHVGGDDWICGNVNVYSPSRPSVFIDVSPRKSPWFDELAWQRDGGVILWDEEEVRPSYWLNVQKRFPHAKRFAPLVVNWPKTPHLPPLLIGIVIVPAERTNEPRIQAKHRAR